MQFMPSELKYTGISKKLKREHLLEPLDHQKIPNIKNLDSDYMNMAYDPHNTYSLPYFWNGRYSIQ